MRKIFCDQCGKEIPAFPTPYGSGWKDTHIRVRLDSNYGGTLPEEYDLCESCGGGIAHELRERFRVVTKPRSDEK